MTSEANPPAAHDAISGQALALRISRNSLVYGAGQLGSRVAALVLVMILARQLSEEQFGVLMVLTALLAICEIASVAGLDWVASRTLAHQGADGWKRLPELVSLAGTLASGIAILLLGAAYWGWFSNVDTALLAAFAAVVVVVAAAAVTDGALQGAQRMAPSAVGLALASFGWLGLSVLVLVVLGPTLTGVILALLAGQTLRLLVLMRAAPAHWVGMRLAPRRWRALLVESGPFALANIMGALMLRQDMLILGWLAGGREAAQYGAAFRFVELCLFVAMIGLVALGPAIAPLRDQPARLRRVYLKSVAISGGLGIAVAAAIFALAEPLLTLVFSHKYSEASTMLRILCAAIVAYLVHVPAMAVLLYAHSTRAMLAVSVTTTALGFVLNLILIPRFGGHGAAIASASAITAGTLMAAALVWHLTRATPNQSPRAP